MYIVTTQFGRIGEEGANQRSPFNSLEDAKNEFGKIFKSKTGNLWEEGDSFERLKGKYMLLNYNKVKLKPNELLKPFDYKKCLKSQLNNTEIQSLLKVFTDSSIIAKAFCESGVDTNLFNYSMLNKEVLLKARNYLMELYKKVEELEEIRKINIVITQNVNIFNEQNKNKNESKNKNKIKKNKSKKRKNKNKDKDNSESNLEEDISEEKMEIEEEGNISKSSSDIILIKKKI